MSYDVLIRKNATGEVRTYRTDECDWYENDEGSTRWMWMEGNYQCDCNRSLFFARAAGEPDPADVECGDDAYTAIKAILPDGREIQIDG